MKLYEKYINSDLNEAKKGIDKSDISRLINFSTDIRAIHAQGESLYAHLSYMKSHILDMLKRHNDYMKGNKQ